MKRHHAPHFVAEVVRDRHIEAAIHRGYTDYLCHRPRPMQRWERRGWDAAKQDIAPHVDPNAPTDRIERVPACSGA